MGRTAASVLARRVARRAWESQRSVHKSAVSEQASGTGLARPDAKVGSLCIHCWSVLGRRARLRVRGGCHHIAAEFVASVWRYLWSEPSQRERCAGAAISFPAFERVRQPLRALVMALGVVSCYLCPLSVETLILSRRPPYEFSSQMSILTT